MQNSWRPTFGPEDCHIEDDVPVFDGYFKMYRLKLRHRRFKGGEIEIQRELFRRGNAVCVLLYDPHRDAVVMVEQFRVGALDASQGPWLLELVAGISEPGESAVDVAVRESDEEAGLAISGVHPISRFLPSPGACDEWIDLMFACVDAAQAQGVHGLPDEGEDIKVQVIDAEAAFELVRNGRINSGPAIIGLQWLELNRARIRGETRSEALSEEIVSTK
ncbi:ADP-ribose pyrophosphatase [Marinobacterium zhoushanense]|uniref:ADP-ribose pyrophosphatase n=1 Tax=Marinobacterium zhoushanense TaxID=1679163 RepID=A0ABQ1KKE0_9GAMM|nr:NUDIX domain-containing protein [Marinobacterium zhoushanense]GGB99824.1 ADP-ribose pyrophosphatase [Marinobacterium zhoushanense]